MKLSGDDAHRPPPARSPPSPSSPVPALRSAIQRNCDLVDATHARELSLCTYLLAMREYFCWARDLPLDAAPARTDVGPWISEREALWESLGACERGLAALPLGSGEVDPYDQGAANAALEASGLVYGAGIGRFGAPVFFLAEQVHRERREEAEVIVVGRELARGLHAPVAVSRGASIVVRTDAMRRWIWSRVEGWQRHPRDDALAAALAAYSAADDRVAAVERMALAQTETLVLHELGEIDAGARLGPDWEAMLAGLGSRPDELFARAVRDLLADSRVTLPTLLGRGDAASIHFWFATFDGVRRELAPELFAAYLDWHAGDAKPLARAIGAGAGRWHELALRLLAVWRDRGAAGIGGVRSELLAG